ncbi:diacylglycerol kinase family protein [Qipengyuania marisflavi]|uniref:diacylglycerol kinase family protein n=1 Tax=Qipengyuania marisflavi TaxID=2486356 RepID=UPI00148679C1|nr:diacylglycerol kinase family protein [Qipengyuania marisflavi]
MTNARSGSNTADALVALYDCCDARGIVVERQIDFPDEELPTPEQLDEAGVGCLAIYTGDGTLNAAITALYGWGGSILVLPGGTMNLLSIRLHGDVDAPIVIERYANQAVRPVRPLMARCEKGDALAGLLAGPGTAWGSVREAMRDFDLSAIAETASQAINETTAGTMLRCAEPARGRPEGYPLIEFSPSDRGMQLDGFSSETTGELLQQSWALLRRQFREGPHIRLGLFDEVTLESVDGGPVEVLIDGEPATLGPRATFTVAACEVDLLATDHGY